MGHIQSYTIRYSLKLVAILLIAAIVGYAALVAAALVPLKPNAQSVLESVDIIQNERKDPHTPEFIPGDPTSSVDNYTELTMLDQALMLTRNDSHPALRALSADILVPANLPGADPNFADAIYAYAEGRAQGDSYATANYSRYWHGWLIYLVPLLSLGLKISAIRMLMQVIGLTLAMILVLQVAKKSKALALALLTYLMVIHLKIVLGSLELTNVFICALAFSVWMVSLRPKSQSFYTLAFFGLGVVQNYFDYLTAPVGAVAIALISYSAIIIPMASKGDFGTSALLTKLPLPLRIFSLIASCAALWAAGYFSFWIVKFALACLAFGRSAAADLMYKVAGRGSSLSLILPTFLKNTLIYKYQIIYYVLPATLALIYLLISSGNIARARVSKTLTSALCTALIISLGMCALTCMWLLIFTRHNFHHSFFTFRNYATIACFPVLFLAWLHYLLDIRHQVN